MHAYNHPAHSWGPVSLNVKPSVYSHGDCRELRSNLLFRLVCASVYVFFHFAALRRAALLASQTYAHFLEYFCKFFPSLSPSIVKNLRVIWRSKRETTWNTNRGKVEEKSWNSIWDFGFWSFRGMFQGNRKLFSTIHFFLISSLIAEYAQFRLNILGCLFLIKLFWTWVQVSLMFG